MMCGYEKNGMPNENKKKQQQKSTERNERRNSVYFHSRIPAALVFNA